MDVFTWHEWLFAAAVCYLAAWAAWEAARALAARTSSRRTAAPRRETR